MSSTPPSGPLGSVLRIGLMVLSIVILASADPPPCDQLSKYTDNDGQWFFDNVCTSAGFKDNCLFYTRGLTTRANDYAAAHQQITVWSVWSRVQYDGGPESPMRCILDHKNGQDGAYFAAMCTAYARLCDNYAEVMAAVPSNPGEDDETSYWLTVELPTIKRAAGPGKIWRVDAFSTEGKDRQVAYLRTSGRLKRAESMAEAMLKGYNSTSVVEGEQGVRLRSRAGTGIGCGATAEQARAFDDCSPGSIPW